MKILCLYNNDCALELFDWIKSEGHDTVLMSDKLSVDWLIDQSFDLAVSYTYRYILTEEMIYALKGNVVNMHNSYLPFNRGADPNIWSIVDGTPRGVTLHFMDASLDKGYIIAQKLVLDGPDETLASSYDNLDKAAKELFKEAFKFYPYWQDMKKQALGKGSYHAAKDAFTLKEKMGSYDCKVEDFKRLV